MQIVKEFFVFLKEEKLLWLSPIVIILLLLAVMIVGDISKGAQRWLDLGVVRFQPSEIMKLAVPMTCAWWLQDRPVPIDTRSLIVLTLAILIPAGLTVAQPDLGTGGLILIGGLMVLVMAGLSGRIMGAPGLRNGASLLSAAGSKVLGVPVDRPIPLPPSQAIRPCRQSHSAE